MKNQTGSYGACKHYNLMSHEEIRNMPIKDIAADNAHLWFWTSNSYMEESYDIIRAWGFEPKSIFTWVKPTLGLGTYLRIPPSMSFSQLEEKLPSSSRDR